MSSHVLIHIFLSKLCEIFFNSILFEKEFTAYDLSYILAYAKLTDTEKGRERRSFSSLLVKV